MSGTSGDGVDASIIELTALDEYEIIKTNILNMILIFIKIFTVKRKYYKIEHLEELHNELNNLERKITLFHAEVIKELNIKMMIL